MEKKEAYRHILPHFQQPGHAYFVTWNIKDAVPPKALERYTQKLEMLSVEIFNLRKKSGVTNSDSPKIIKHELEFLAPEHATPIEKLKQEYYLIRKKYIKAYDDLLDVARNPEIELSRAYNTKIVIQSLLFWEGKKLTNLAISIMPNHVHWVFELFEKDQEGNPIYLQDILQSVKRFSANQLNKAENMQGSLWQKESFDTTIRDEKHLYYAVRYTLNNPVKAGLVSEWRNWKGTWASTDFSDL
jgi:putative transposase